MWFRNCVLNRGAVEKEIDARLGTLRLAPPSDYVDVLRTTDGCEGFVGRAYLHLYSLEQMIRLNEAYRVEEFVPGFERCWSR